jgi:hypothetical protein
MIGFIPVLLALPTNYTLDKRSELEVLESTTERTTVEAQELNISASPQERTSDIA